MFGPAAMSPHLGHEKPSETQDVYPSRKIVAAEAAWR
jgi:hypothetical protein